MAANKHNCRICGKPVYLRPSATERAKKYGETVEFYREIFRDHAECIVNKRSKESNELLARLAPKQENV